MFNASMTIAEFDPELAKAIAGERKRQEDHVELIASENYTSPRVLEAQGSVLTNKYAEGYPGKRYYGGCEYVDIAESLAIDRAKRLFGADFANVQPHSGSQANAAVYLALLNPGDPILGMSLDHGGHLTHGAKVNFSGKLFKAAQYGIKSDTGEIDYDQVRRLAQEHRPKMIIAGFSAYSRVIDWARFRHIADSVGAYFVVDMAHVAGLVAAGLYPNPVPFADVATTTTHKTLRGPRGGLILARPNPEIQKKLNSMVFPGIQGGPLMHVIAAQGGGIPGGVAAGVQDVLRAGHRECARHGPGAAGARLQDRLGRHRQSPVSLGSRRQGHHRQRRRCRARPCPHDGQQERRAQRSAPAHGHERPADRDAGGDDAGLSRKTRPSSCRTGSRMCSTIEATMRPSSACAARSRRCAGDSPSMGERRPPGGAVLGRSHALPLLRPLGD